MQFLIVFKSSLDFWKKTLKSMSLELATEIIELHTTHVQANTKVIRFLEFPSYLNRNSRVSREIIQPDLLRKFSSLMYTH